MPQNLTAKVVDENNQPLIGATVYFDGTTRGVITDMDGVFNIKKPENLNNPILVITYLGYQNIFETDVENLKAVYQLQPQPENLDTVNLYSSPFSRKDMMKVFKKYFLGKGKAARRCEIENLDDIILYYVVKENTLYAKATNPIVVNNKYLGYKVKFDLKAFKVNYRRKSLEDFDLIQTYYAGFSFFEDVNPKKERKRIKIYKGSQKHFFKSLVNETFDETKFQIFYKRFERTPEQVFDIEKLNDKIFKISLISKVRTIENLKYIPTEIILRYKKEASALKFKKPEVRVDRYGNTIDIQNIFLTGHMASFKIAKLLPLNFSLKVKVFFYKINPNCI